MQATERRERPIIFSGEMVRAILDGRKTMTRRVLTSVLKRGRVTEFGPSDTSGYDWHFRDRHKSWHDLHHDDLLARCPYGKPGDLLWVRETWASSRALDRTKPSNLLPGFPCEFRAGGCSIYGFKSLVDRGRWRPSIHMPRWASRIMLEVTDVQAEQVQDIDQADAIAEGMTNAYECKGSVYYRPERDAFRILWDSLNAIPKPRYATVNGKRIITHYESFPFDGESGTFEFRGKPHIITVNPWVWVVESKQVEATA